MTLWNPIWRVTIDGTYYTEFVLANFTAQSGRTNIYEQAQAGYCNISLYNVTQSQVDININDSVTIELKDSTNTFVPIFGGNVVDLTVEVTDGGSIAISQMISITALGALARLPKALTNGVLSKAHDGTQILAILTDLLINNWSEVPPAIQWSTYPPTETWATAQNTGLGDIDTPGEYELMARSSDRTDVYSLVAGIATSGLGYIYEDGLGRISYADALHRSTYLATYGYTDVSANDALAAGIQIQTRAGDVRNEVTINYDNGSKVTRSDPVSIANFGLLAQSIDTTIEKTVDATYQANFYLGLRSYPQPMMQSITFELTNPELSDGDRDALIKIFMGLPLRISDLPLNMTAGTYAGFVEGWQFSAGYNTISVTALLSPLSYSLQAMAWEDVPVGEHWNTISGTLEWQDAIVVA